MAAETRRNSTAPDEGPDPGTVPPKANGAEDVPTAPARVREATARVAQVGARPQAAARSEASTRSGASIANVIGEDQRTRIHATSTYPYRAIASLLIVAANGDPLRGTGFFITPRTLVTAGHCVCPHDRKVPEQNGPVQSIEVIPGRNGDERPFGSAVSSTFRAPAEWTEGADKNFDYAVIILDTPLGAAVGSFGYGVYTNAQLRDVTANISGYPGGERSGTQWFHSSKLKEIMTARVAYDIDVDDGQSGSPIWRIINRRRFAFAIHTDGGRSRNSGTRITAAVHANLTAWKV